MKTAEKILMEVHRMRQYENQFAQAGSKHLSSKVVTRQNRMPTLEEAKSLLSNYNMSCQEIELEDTTGYLKSLIEISEERVANATTSKSNLSDLVIIQEHLKKTPLNVEAISYELSERIVKAHEFIRKLKHMTPEIMARDISSLKEEYEHLGLKIADFEKSSTQFTSELEKCSDVEMKFKDYTLREIIVNRAEIMNHQFYRDKALETKLLIKKVNLLEEEFIKLNEGFDDGDDNPMFDLVSLEALQKEIVDMRKNSKSSNKGQFLMKLISDIKKHLSDHIYSLDLEGISKLKSYCYKKFVDITKEITDHKIRLEISSNPQKAASKGSDKKKEPTNEIKKYDAFGLFGSDFALISKSSIVNTLQNEVVEAPKKHVVDMDIEEDTQKENILEGKPTTEDAADKEKRGNRKRREGPYVDSKKPNASGELISSQLRQYFVNSIKHWMEKNDKFEISGLDSLMVANNLERQIYEKYMDSSKSYDEICEVICKVFRSLIPMKHLSIHIRNKGFRLSILIKLTDKDRFELRKIDGFAKAKLNKNKKIVSDEMNNVDEDDEEDKLLENLGEGKQQEEKEVYFSDLDSEFNEDDQEKENDNVEVKASKVLCYDPESGQYQFVKNKFDQHPQNCYTYYNIFKGGVYFETKEKLDLKKKPDRTNMYTCTGEEFIRYFTEIPEGLQLSSQLSKFEFDQYIQKVLMSDQALNYLLLPFWVESSTPLTIKNFYRNNECLGSIQYSPRCKIFVFPREYLKQEWLSVLNFFIVKKEITPTELVGFIVLKLVSSDSYEVSVIPEPAKVEKAHKAFKLIKSGADVAEKIIDIELLKENKNLEDLASPEHHTSNFLEDIIGDLDNEKDDNKNKKVNKTKLQKLMANELSTTQSPQNRHSFKGSNNTSQIINEEQNPSYNSELLNALRAGGSAKKESNSNSAQLFNMLSNSAGKNNNDDAMSDADKLSKISSVDEVDAQMLGKRQVYPPHISNMDGGRSNNMNMNIKPKTFNEKPNNMKGNGMMNDNNRGPRMNNIPLANPQNLAQNDFNNMDLGAPTKMIKTQQGNNSMRGVPRNNNNFNQGGNQMMNNNNNISNPGVMQANTSGNHIAGINSGYTGNNNMHMGQNQQMGGNQYYNNNQSQQQPHQMGGNNMNMANGGPNNNYRGFNNNNGGTSNRGGEQQKVGYQGNPANRKMNFNNAGGAQLPIQNKVGGNNMIVNNNPARVGGNTFQSNNSNNSRMDAPMSMNNTGMGYQGNIANSNRGGGNPGMSRGFGQNHQQMGSKPHFQQDAGNTGGYQGQSGNYRGFNNQNTGMSNNAGGGYQGNNNRMGNSGGHNSGPQNKRGGYGMNNGGGRGSYQGNNNRMGGGMRQNGGMMQPSNFK